MTIKEFTEHHIYVETDDRTGNHLDGVYLKSRRQWRLPFNLGALRDLHLAGYDVKAIGENMATIYRTINSMKSRPFKHEIGGRLREYQQQDLNFLLNQKYAGVFNEQRTGKTPMACRLLQHINKKAIIICPASLILNWRDELKEWTHLAPIAYIGTKTQRYKLAKKFEDTERAVLIMSVGTLRNDINMMIGLGAHTVVVDEAHFLRNRKSKQTEAVYSLGRTVERRYALTGTPATKHPSDVFGILHFLDHEKWNSYWQFAERYFTVSTSFYNPNAKELKGFKSELRKKEYEELLNVISVQRKRKDVMQWLPPKQYQTIKLKMEKEQKKAYDDMRTMFESEELGIDASTVLSQMLRLRQITSAPEVFGATGAKAKFLHEYIDNNPGQQTLVFSNFSAGLRAISSSFKSSALITGRESKEERREATRDFQNGKIQILFCNIIAAGTGLTLDRADAVIFLDRHYNPSENEQSEDRIVATTEGSNLNALVIDLVCEGTIDEKVLEIVKEKKSVTEVANNYKNLKEWLG